MRWARYLLFCLRVGILYDIKAGSTGITILYPVGHYTYSDKEKRIAEIEQKRAMAHIRHERAEVKKDIVVDPIQK